MKEDANNFYKLVDFPLADTKNGILSMLQNVGFDIKRVLVMKDMKESDVRGGHTHHQTKQILFAVNGGCTVDMDNGREKASVKLAEFNQGLFLEPYVWHVMKDFLPNTVLLVLADTEYDEKDYIRDYEEFLKLISS